MLRDHMLNFLEAAVVFLMLTNAFSIAAAAYALALTQRATRMPLPRLAAGEQSHTMKELDYEHSHDLICF